MSPNLAADGKLKPPAITVMKHKFKPYNRLRSQMFIFILNFQYFYILFFQSSIPKVLLILKK